MYAAAQYPLALTPVVLLPVYTAAAVLPPRRGRWLLAAAVLLGLPRRATASPGPTDTSVPLLVASAWFLRHSVGQPPAYTESWRPRTGSWSRPSTSWPSRR